MSRRKPQIFSTPTLASLIHIPVIQAMSVFLIFFLLNPVVDAQNRRNRIDRIDDHFSTRRMDRQRPGNRGQGLNPDDIQVQRFRTIDGSFNNLGQSTWGAATVQLWRRVPAAYSDGLNVPARSLSASPREISNVLCAQSESIPNSKGLTDMVWQWGQFLDHDIDLTETHEPAEFFPVLVPDGDPWFDPEQTGTQLIFLFRSAYNPATGINSPRQQMNLITSWIDGSNVYGSDEETAASLRHFRNGMLKVSASEFGHLLPMDEDGFFRAGDVRANEQVYLTAMHTLFMREHNRICRQLLRASPDLTDEQLYRNARKRVGAIIQSITYNEFLPAILGENALRPYRGYNARVFPNIANVFSTGAYRFGHTMLNSELLRLDVGGNVIPEGNLQLTQAFFSPDEIVKHGIDPYLNGLIHQLAQEIDGHVVDDVRNFLFGLPGAGGFDLASLNIQRGRDHGLPGINQIRIAYGLPPYDSFEDITTDPEVLAKLEQLYANVDEIDPWICMLCEKHIPGASLGSTAHRVIKDQFERLRDGDRFWYQTQYSGAALEGIENTRLSNIIRRNSGVKSIRRDVFRLVE